MDIDGIKQWLEEAIEFFEEVISKRRDIQENIACNRRIFGVPYRKRDEIKAWVEVYKPAALPYLVELAAWIKAYYHYFDTGYESEWSIDELPGLILERLQFIRAKIESL